MMTTTKMIKVVVRHSRSSRILQIILDIMEHLHRIFLAPLLKLNIFVYNWAKHEARAAERSSYSFLSMDTDVTDSAMTWQDKHGLKREKKGESNLVHRGKLYNVQRKVWIDWFIKYYFTVMREQ
eukprot:2308906-Ditylum_brightwellii.AAC.1